MGRVALRPLLALANKINDAHLAVRRSAEATLERARAAGELLAAAKAQVGHGGWRHWLAENVECSERTAQLYMSVADQWDSIVQDPRFPAITLQESVRKVRPAIAGRLPKSNPQPVADSEPILDRNTGALEPEPARKTRVVVPAAEPESAASRPSRKPATWRRAVSGFAEKLTFHVSALRVLSEVKPEDRETLLVSEVSRLLREAAADLDAFVVEWRAGRTEREAL